MIDMEVDWDWLFWAITHPFTDWFGAIFKIVDPVFVFIGFFAVIVNMIALVSYR